MKSIICLTLVGTNAKLARERSEITTEPWVFFFSKVYQLTIGVKFNYWEIVLLMTYQQCNKHVLWNKSQADKCILLYKLKHEKDLFVVEYVPVNNYGYVGTYIQHWDVMKCVLSFEVWHPSNRQKFICMDGLTPHFMDRIRLFKRVKSNHVVGQSEILLGASSQSERDNKN